MTSGGRERVSGKISSGILSAIFSPTILSPVILSGALWGCLPDRADPAAFGYIPDYETPALAADAGPAPEVDAELSTRLSPRPPPSLEPDGPEAETPAPWPDHSLPTPWAAERMRWPLIAQDHARQIVATERPVGVVPLAQRRYMLVEAGGGLFLSEDPLYEAGGWIPLPTPIEGPITRVEPSLGGALICRGEAAEALSLTIKIGADLHDPSGRDLIVEPLGFQCGQGGRRTAVAALGTLFALVDGPKLWVRPRSGAPATYELPLADPQVITALDDQRVIILGGDGVAVTYDGGLSFRQGDLGEGLTAFYDAAPYGKSSIMAVGVAPPGRPGMIFSEDLGQRWQPLITGSRQGGALQRLALDARGVGVVVPEGGGQGFQISPEGLAPIQSRYDLHGSPLTLAEGQWWLLQDRGLASDLGREAPAPLGLDQPLWRALYFHPLVAVGAGVEAGLFLTEDGGLTWRKIPGTAGVRFTTLARGEGGLLLAGGASQIWSGSLWAGAGQQMRWRRATTPHLCDLDWLVPLSEDTALGGCEDGTLLQSSDGFERWRWIASPPSPLAAPILLKDGALVAVTRGGGQVWRSEDSGRRWSPQVTAEGALLSAVALKADPAGLASLSASGLVSQARQPEGPWRAVGEPIPGPVDLIPLQGGGALVLGRSGVHHVRDDAPSRRVLSAEQPIGWTTTGDGGVLIFEAARTALWSPR